MSKTLHRLCGDNHKLSGKNTRPPRRFATAGAVSTHGRGGSNDPSNQPIAFDGGRTQARTVDPLIKSRLLYQLSYAPIKRHSLSGRRGRLKGSVL